MLYSLLSFDDDHDDDDALILASSLSNVDSDVESVAALGKVPEHNKVTVLNDMVL